MMIPDLFSYLRSHQSDPLHVKIRSDEITESYTFIYTHCRLVGVTSVIICPSVALLAVIVYPLLCRLHGGDLILIYRFGRVLLQLN